MSATDKQFEWKDGEWLKAHFEVRLAAMEKAVEAASAAMEQRLGTMNEFRNSLRDQATQYVTIVEHKALCDRIDRIDKAIRDLELSKAELGGKASQASVTNVQMLTLVSLLIGIVGIVLKFL